MQLTKNFSLVEFIDPAIYKEFGDKSIRFLDSRIPLIAQEVKDILSSHYGKNVRVTINGNLNGHTYTESGLRQINTTATWLHLSTRYTLSKGLNIVQP